MYSLNLDGKQKPLRRIIRELVWMSFMNANQVNDTTLNEESPFRVAFEKSHAGMAVADLSGRIQFVNTAFANLLGRTQKTCGDCWWANFHTQRI